MFITFEGGEGSGKTTQARLLAEYIQSLGYSAILTREPGGTPIAESLRNIVVQRSSRPMGKISPLTEALIFLAARSDHWEKVIKPALDHKKIVICDRFHDSSLVYQNLWFRRRRRHVYKTRPQRGQTLCVRNRDRTRRIRQQMGKVDRTFLNTVYKHITGGIVPDRTYIIDIDTRIGLKRSLMREGSNIEDAGPVGSETRFEYKSFEYHQRVRRGYLELAKGNDRYLVISVQEDWSQDFIHNLIIKDFNKLIKSAPSGPAPSGSDIVGTEADGSKSHGLGNFVSKSY